MVWLEMAAAIKKLNKKNSDKVRKILLGVIFLNMFLNISVIKYYGNLLVKLTAIYIPE